MLDLYDWRLTVLLSTHFVESQGLSSIIFILNNSGSKRTKYYQTVRMEQVQNLKFRTVLIGRHSLLRLFLRSRNLWQASFQHPNNQNHCQIQPQDTAHLWFVFEIPHGFGLLYGTAFRDSYPQSSWTISLTTSTMIDTRFRVVPWLILGG